MYIVTRARKNGIISKLQKVKLTLLDDTFWGYLRLQVIRNVLQELCTHYNSHVLQTYNIPNARSLVQMLYS